MVDTLALGASGGNPVEVQVLSSAPRKTHFVRLVARHGYRSEFFCVSW